MSCKTICLYILTFCLLVSCTKDKVAIPEAIGESSEIFQAPCYIPQGYFSFLTQGEENWGENTPILFSKEKYDSLTNRYTIQFYGDTAQVPFDSQLYFEVIFDGKPETGIYGTSPEADTNQVLVFYRRWSSAILLARQDMDQEFYVDNTNGNISVSFCDVYFSLLPDQTITFCRGRGFFSATH